MPVVRTVPGRAVRQAVLGGLTAASPEFVENTDQQVHGDHHDPRLGGDADEQK